MILGGISIVIFHSDGLSAGTIGMLDITHTIITALITTVHIIIIRSPILIIHTGITVTMTEIITDMVMILEISVQLEEALPVQPALPGPEEIIHQ